MVLLPHRFFASAFATLALLSWLTGVHAGDFTVSPIRLELDANARSGVISVRNEGDIRLGFQLQAMEWTQDAEGKDQYADSRDLIFFPKLMTLEPGDESVVRVGVRNAVVPIEKTYRLFIQELPGPTKEPQPEGKSARIGVLIRFGAPIFLAPLKAEDRAEITALEMAKGTLSLKVKNTGNRHQVIEGIHLRGTDRGGAEVFSLTLADRYLLAGATKGYSTSIAAASCSMIADLTVELKTDKLGLKRKLDVTGAMCQ
jgi:fimbrial chaperone protein